MSTSSVGEGPVQQASGEMTIYIGGIPHGVEKTHVETVIKEASGKTPRRMMLQKGYSTRPGYAMATFETAEDAKEALEALESTELMLGDKRCYPSWPAQNRKPDSRSLFFKVKDGEEDEEDDSEEGDDSEEEGEEGESDGEKSEEDVDGGVEELLRKALGEFGDLGYFKIINLGGENHSTTGCVDFNSETEATNAIGASMSQRGIKLGRRKRLFLEPFLPIEDRYTDVYFSMTPPRGEKGGVEEITEQDVEAMFKVHGEIKSLTLEQPGNRSWGIVRFEEHASAKGAVESLAGEKDINGWTIVVGRSRSRAEQNKKKKEGRAKPDENGRRVFVGNLPSDHHMTGEMLRQQLQIPKGTGVRFRQSYVLLTFRTHDEATAALPKIKEEGGTRGYNVQWARGKARNLNTPDKKSRRKRSRAGGKQGEKNASVEN